MLGFLKTQQAALALAAGAAFGAIGVWYGVSSLPSIPAAPRTETATPAAAQAIGAPSPSGAAIDATVKGGDSPAAASVQRPEFDIVRVEPSGDSVVAGRGVPGATISLVEGGTTLARAVADPNGEVVFLPPALAPGEHVLALLSVQTGAAPLLSSRSVTVVVPGASKNAPVVALAAPGSPVPTGPGGGPSVGAPAAAVPVKAVPEVAIRTAEAEMGGSFFATGSAPPGSQSRLYLNGAFLASVIADVNGLWSIRVEKGMRPGNYVVRADEVEAESGKVVARAEVPFNFPEPPVPSPKAMPSDNPVGSSGSGSPPGQPVASPGVVAIAGSSSAPMVIKEIRTATVVRGDNLWRISRRMLGRGIRYTQIYEANVSQIRNPRLVFPGQVFVVPGDPG
jgi:nucleoid-associated protein YgaU